jgi:hypothetical protein
MPFLHELTGMWVQDAQMYSMISYVKMTMPSARASENQHDPVASFVKDDCTLLLASSRLVDTSHALGGAVHSHYSNHVNAGGSAQKALLGHARVKPTRAGSRAPGRGLNIWRHTPAPQFPHVWVGDRWGLKPTRAPEPPVEPTAAVTVAWMKQRTRNHGAGTAGLALVAVFQAGRRRLSPALSETRPGGVGFNDSVALRQAAASLRLTGERPCHLARALDSFSRRQALKGDPTVAPHNEGAGPPGGGGVLLRPQEDWERSRRAEGGSPQG